MIDLKKIPLRMLGAIRQRQGADNENDTIKDDYIATRSPKELARLWAGWHLGYEEWADDIIEVYEKAQEAEIKEGSIK